MQKITFEDTQVTKKPYVTINEAEYEVQDGTYTGGTDLNATTFNNMQDNIESAIDENTNNIGNLTDLNTTEKSTLVGAINENNNNIGDLSSLITTNKTSVIDTINETNQKINKVNLVKADGKSDGVLIAEVNFTDKYQRYVLIFATTLTGHSDNNESGIYNLGISNNIDKTAAYVSYSVIGETSTNNIYHTYTGTNLKIYLKKTSEYRNLYATLLGKSDEVIWKLT